MKYNIVDIYKLFLGGNSTKESKWKIFRSSILAGICIGISGLGFIKVGGGLIGAAIFGCGLVAVCLYSLQLYTGVAGFTKDWVDFTRLPLILFGNVLGCWVISWIASTSFPDISQAAQEVVISRLSKTPFQATLLGLGCGWLMTIAVTALKPSVSIEKRTWIPLLFSVPMFILCGFLHSIADSFYFLTCGWEWLKENIWEVLKIWGSVVLGNWIGCNLSRILRIPNPYK